MKTIIVKKSESPDNEYLIVNPPHTVFGNPVIPQSQSIIMTVGGLRKMIKDLDDEDDFRIEWFAENRAIEYSFFKKKNKK